MYLVVLAIHVLVCICLIGLVLLQRSEGGALGMGGGGSSSLMSGRGAADALARMTQFAGAFFLITSLSLTVISGAASSSGSRSIFDTGPANNGLHFRDTTVPAPGPAPTPAQPAPARPDPTQSSAPQALPHTELASTNPVASILPGPATAAAATPPRTTPVSDNAAHAAPITASRPAVTPPVQHTQPATTPVSTAPAHTAPAHTQSATATTQHSTTPALVLPQSPGALALTQTGAQSGESTDPNAVTAVRRERAAGPDQ